LTDLTDAQLVVEYRNGNARAFDFLIDRYKRPLFSYLGRVVGEKETAEDMFQDVFIKVIKNIKNYNESGKFHHWLFKIASNLVIDYGRRNHKKTQIFQQVSDSDFEKAPSGSITIPSQKIEHKEIRVMLDEAIQKLPEEQKQVLLLREHSGLTFKEIASILDRPLNTVLAQMRYALLSLRKNLEKKYAGEIQHVLQ